MTGETGLRVDGLTVRDGERTLVDGLSFVVEHAGWVVLTGEDGGDVSTVLAALAGRWPVAQGAATFDGEPLWAARAAHQIGYTRADRNLIGTLTAVENLAVVLLEAGHRSPASAWARAERQLTEVGLAPSTWHNLAEQLSGGQQQRVALARALVGRPRLLVLDNPTSELDPDSAARVVSVLDRARSRGTCCVLASSDETLLEACPTRVSL